MYEGVSDELPVEAIVARNMGDPDWEELCTDSQFNNGCSRKPTYEPERLGRFEAEPVTIKDVAITRRRFPR